MLYVASFRPTLLSLGFPHVGLLRGRCLIDSRITHGIQHRGLDERPIGLVEVDAQVEAEVWRRAQSRVGDPYQVCHAFVCWCLDERVSFDRLLPGRARSYIR